MPLGIYKELVKITEDNRDTASLEMIAVLSGMTLDGVMNLPIAEVSRLSDKLAFLAEQPRELNGKIANRYKIGGYECDPVTDMQKMTTAQYIDFQTYASKMKDADMTAELLTCLLVPHGKTYNEGYDVTSLRDAIEAHLPIVDAMNLANFFLTSLQGLITRFLTYSGLMTKKMARKARKTGNEEMEKASAMISARTKALTDLARVGDGLLTLTRALKLPDVVGMR